MANCAYCGGPIPAKPWRNGHPSKFCSANCYRLQVNKLQRLRIAAQKTAQEKTPAANLISGRNFKTKRCKGCGKLFTPTRPNQQYCTPTCDASNFVTILPPAMPAPPANLPEPENNTLDKKLRQLHKNGTSYAEKQRAESIKLFAHIDLEA